MLTIPFKYQKKGVKKAWKFGGRVLCADDMGLGKSLESLMWMEEAQAFPTVVVCPAFLKWNWEREAMKHFGMHAEVLEGRKPSRGWISKPKLIIVNYDILMNWVPYLRRGGPKLVIGDECQYVSNPETQRTKAFQALCEGVKYVWGLSGTPLENRPIELFTILNILLPKKYNSYFDFGFKFCGPKMVKGELQYKGATNIPLLNKQLRKRCMIRRLKVDVLKDLPPKRRHIVLIDIEKRREYTNAERDTVTWLRKTSATRGKQDRKAERYLQYMALKKLTAELKLKFVMEWIDNFLASSTGKLLAFGHHKHLIHTIAARYGKAAITVTGEVTGKKRQHAFDAFANEDVVRLCVGNDAAGTGWDGTAAQAVAFFELYWKPTSHTQKEDRAWRYGQEGQVDVYYLLGKDTVEVPICKLNQDKQLVISGVLDGKGDAKDFDIFDQLEKELLYATKQAG